LSGKKIGLALGSGAARGLAHVGVLDVLERSGIRIDMIAGTSMGAMVGAFYAAGMDISQMEKAAKDLTRRRMLALADFTLPTKGLFKGNKIAGWLKSIIGDKQFTDLSLPFACVATDIITGEAVVINEGSVVSAVMASVSIPVIITPAKIGGRYLVDGGLVNPLPVNVLKDMGADFIIAVNVVPSVYDLTSKADGARVQKVREPNIFEVTSRMLYIIGFQAALTGIKSADITITPDVGHIRPDSFYRARECILLGKRAARHALPEIKRLLEA